MVPVDLFWGPGGGYSTKVWTRMDYCTHFGGANGMAEEPPIRAIVWYRANLRFPHILFFCNAELRRPAYTVATFSKIFKRSIGNTHKKYTPRYSRLQPYYIHSIYGKYCKDISLLQDCCSNSLDIFLVLMDNKKLIQVLF